MIKKTAQITTLIAATFFLGKAHASIDVSGCDSLKGTTDYSPCVRLAMVESSGTQVDCVECLFAAQEREKNVGDYIVEGLGVVAGPLAYFGSTWLQTNAQRDINQQWSDAYKESNQNWSAAYQHGFDSCGSQFSTYTSYLDKNGFNPPSESGVQGMMSSCNNSASMLGMYAGMNGMMGSGMGMNSGGMNGYYSAGYSPGMMSGMMGPYAGGGGGAYLNFGLNGGMNGGMNGMNGMYGMNGMNGGLNGGLYLNGGMNGGMNGMGNYGMNGMNGSGMMYPGGMSGMNGMAGLSGYMPGMDGMGSYWNGTGGWGSGNSQYLAQQQAYQQQMQQQQQLQQQQQQQQQQAYQAWLQQQQAVQSQNSSLWSRSQANQTGNIAADQALASQYQTAATDYYRNQNMGSYYGSYPYSMGGMNSQFSYGFNYGFGI